MSHSALLTRLGEELRLLRALLAQLEQQQHALIQGHSEGVLACAQASEELLDSLQEESRQRARLMQQQGWSSLEAATAACTSLRERTQLRALAPELTALSWQLHQQHAYNQALIAQGQQLVGETLQQFIALQQQGQPAVYGAAGTQQALPETHRALYDFNA
ncbi:MAG: flagellar export chaperone FlgN [Candidatus Sericytochromatia bacterium]